MPLKLVENKNELSASFLRFITLSESSASENSIFFVQRITNAKRFVVLGFDKDNYLFAPSAYVAYSGCSSMQEWDVVCKTKGRNRGRRHIEKLLSDAVVKQGHSEYENLKKHYIDYCSKWGNKKPAADNKYKVEFWLLSSPDSEMSYPDEVESGTTYYEGVCRRVEVNSYERDKNARQACIAYYGNRYRCEICHFNFEEAYGLLGKQYIHVHHLVPLANIGKGYHVDPAKDLLPVCCNCHAVIHRQRGSVISPKDLHKLVQSRSKLS